MSCYRIRHFRVHISFHFEASLLAKSWLWVSLFIHIEIRPNCHNRHFALRFALKKRLKELGNGLLNSLPLFHAAKAPSWTDILWLIWFVASLPPGADGAPSLMTFREVETLFHEVHIEIPVILCRRDEVSSKAYHNQNPNQKQEPMSRSIEHHYILVTGFS